MTTDLLYFGNPMCSWCWGFSPIIQSMHQEFGRDIKINLGLGSLRQDERPMTPQQKQTIRNHWQHVVERSGQPFDFTFFDRDDFCYDDRLPSTMIAAVRQSDPDRALDLFHRLQGAFYRDNRDITSSEVMSTILAECDLDGDAIGLLSQSIDIATEFHETARLGVSGYPTLLALSEGKAELITLGYSDWTDVRSRLISLIE